MGWVAATITLVRDYTNEASVNAKWTDAKIIQQLELAFTILTPQIMFASSQPNSVRASLTTTASTNSYILPPHFGEILQIAVMTDNNRVKQRIRPRSYDNPAGPGMYLNGRVLTFRPDWTSNDTLEIWYIPNGEIKLAEGTLGSGAQSTSSLTVTAATTGTLDTRANAYAGYMLSLTDTSGSNAVEERMVTASSFSAGTTTFTIDPVFTFTPAASSDLYEVRPFWSENIRMTVALQASLQIVRAEGMTQREQSLLRSYAQALGAARSIAANVEGIVGDHFRFDTIDNPDYVGNRFF